MSRSVAPLVLLACLMAGCSPRSAPDGIFTGIAARETTGSVVKPPSPVPAVAVGGPPAQPSPVARSERLAWSGPLPPSPMARQEPARAAVPEIRPVALLSMPKNPAAFPSSDERMRVYGQRFSDAKPINFGKVTPRDYPVHGVDVSRWQQNIDWQKLRAHGGNFAYIKATDGGDHLDPMFRTNWQAAKAAGLKRGAYHFFYWCRVASEQAAWFIRNVPKDPDALPPVIDVEWNGLSSCRKRPPRAVVLEKMRVFMEMVERHYGKRPIIYTAPDFYRDNLSGEFRDYPFWLRAVAEHPSKVYPGRKWLFWQYSGSGLSQGVNGKIDLNVFHGSEKQWHAWLAGLRN